MAARAGLSSGEQQRIAGRTIKTVASRAFGIKAVSVNTRREYVAHLVQANDPLPADVTEGFATLDDYQTRVAIEVMEQAGAEASDARRGQQPDRRGRPGDPAGQTGRVPDRGDVHPRHLRAAPRHRARTRDRPGAEPERADRRDDGGGRRRVAREPVAPDGQLTPGCRSTRPAMCGRCSTRRARPALPPDDLLVRYALGRDLAEVGETVKAVRQCWRRQRSQLKFRRLVDRLEADHARLAPSSTRPPGATSGR